MKYLGFPLVGDYLYNPDMEFITRQALHSCRLSFEHPITRVPLSFEALNGLWHDITHSTDSMIFRSLC